MMMRLKTPSTTVRFASRNPVVMTTPMKRWEKEIKWAALGFAEETKVRKPL